MPAQFLHGGICSHFDIHQYKIHYTMSTFPPCWCKTTISIKQVKELRKIGKNITKQNSDVSSCCDVDHTGCFLKKTSPHTWRDKVIFPPCLWNRSTKIKVWETSSIRNTDRKAMATRQIHQKNWTWDYHCLFSMTSSCLAPLREQKRKNHIFLSLVWHRHVISTRVVALCCLLHLHVWEAEHKKSILLLSLSLLIFQLENVDCCDKPHRGRQTYSSEQRGCTSEKRNANTTGDREIWVHGLASSVFCQLFVSTLFQLKTYPKQ